MERGATTAEPPGTFCLASRLLLEGGVRVGLMYREKPFATEDSGWRFFGGEEDGGFVADPRNVPCVPLADIVARHPEVESLLGMPRGAACERDASGRLGPVE